MAAIRRQKVARKQIDQPPAGFAIEHLDPEEGFHRYIGVAVEGTERPVILIKVGAQGVDESTGSLFISRNVKLLDFLADDPGRHRIDIEAEHVASDAVRLDQRRSAAHKRIRYPDSRKVIRSEKGIIQTIFPELGKDQAAKQGARTACEPLVNADDRAIALLDLLFPERHFRDQGNVKTLLDTHCRRSTHNHARLRYRGGQMPRFYTTPMTDMTKIVPD